MSIQVRKYTQADIDAMRDVWNEVVDDGRAFPQENRLGDDAAEFFAGQSYCGVALDGDEIVGMYILHPNNVGRCGHICNASYAVKGSARGKGVGRALVTDCLLQAKDIGFRVLQFNAVVASNAAAIGLYDSLGFDRIGTVKGGFHNIDGVYEDIILFCYYLLPRAIAPAS